MAVIETPETVGIRPFHEFDDANGLWPRGGRPEAIRAAAGEFRTRFKAQGELAAVRTVPLVSAPYPAKYAFGGAAKAVYPYVNIINRLVVVQFEDFEGDLRILVWEPTIPEGSAEAPFYAQLAAATPQWMQDKLATEYNTLDAALALAGVAPADVDFVSFDHLHVQDMRRLMGTTKPVDGESEPRPPYFPDAKFLVQRKEAATLESVHPMQWAWYVPDGMRDVREDSLVLLEGDVELGKGVAILWTPGHTDGNHSLVINTPEGIWVSSENGVCADNWQPHLSKIPGIKGFAEYMGREVVLNSNTLEDSLDQYDSMVKEKAVADSVASDPRWLQVFPSSEMATLRRQWPVVPTYAHGGVNYGAIATRSA